MACRFFTILDDRWPHSLQTQMKSCMAFSDGDYWFPFLYDTGVGEEMVGILSLDRPYLYMKIEEQSVG